MNEQASVKPAISRFGTDLTSKRTVRRSLKEEKRMPQNTQCCPERCVLIGLAFHTTRVHSDTSIESKFAAAFVAAIIRSQMLNLCKRLGFDVNKMILETDRCRIFKTTSDTYDFTNDMLSSTSSFLAGLGLSQRHF